MVKRSFFFITVFLVILACDLPGTLPPTPIPTYDVNLISTMVVQTAEKLALSATAANTTPSATATAMPTSTASMTETPTSAPPTVTVTDIPPATATPIPPTATSVPAASMFVNISGDYILVIFTPTVTLTPSITPTSTQVIITCAETKHEFEARVIELINAERAKAGLSALKPQHQLTAAAQVYSADMACHNYLSHAGRDGSHFAERAERQGYKFEYGGENLAGGYSTPEEVVKGWMNSPGHKANILNEHYVDIGVGYAYYTQSDYVAYWAAEFGSPK